MGNSAKLKDIGEIQCETRFQGGEWLVLYNDPDNPNKGKGIAEYVSIYGAGLAHRKPLDTLSGLAADLRKRGYTGTVKNMKPMVIVKKNGIKQ